MIRLVGEEGEFEGPEELRLSHLSRYLRQGPAAQGAPEDPEAPAAQVAVTQARGEDLLRLVHSGYRLDRASWNWCCALPS